MKVITRSAFGLDVAWLDFVEVLGSGHALARAQVDDTFLGPPDKTLLSRAARIEGFGFGVKSVTVIPDNPSQGRPSVQGGMLFFDEATGIPKAIIDSALITDIKTAVDSVVGACYLARPDSRKLLVLGAGCVTRNVIAAYAYVVAWLERVEVWNRNALKAEALTTQLTTADLPVSAVTDLASAVATADIVSFATMARDPVLRGRWLRPGTHVDLIGAFRSAMREADDEALKRAELYVDSKETTLDHIGELKVPLAAGTISASDIRADLYQMKAAGPLPRDPEKITLFKNGGGAHLDLMTANAILEMEPLPDDRRQTQYA